MCDPYTIDGDSDWSKTGPQLYVRRPDENFPNFGQYVQTKFAPLCSDYMHLHQGISEDFQILYE